MFKEQFPFPPSKPEKDSSQEEQKEKTVEQEIVLDPEIEAILAKENLIVDKKELTEKIQKKSRHLNLVCEIKVGERVEKRFLKILNPHPEDPEREETDRRAFVREAKVNQFLREKTKVPALKVGSANLEPAQGRFYALYETLPPAEKIGFISKRREQMKLLTKEHAQKCIENIFNLQEEVKSALGEAKLSEEIADLEDVFDSYQGYEENVLAILEEKVFPLDGKVNKKGRSINESLDQVLGRRLGIANLRRKFKELFKVNRPAMKKEDDKEEVLVHGDLAPSNTYIDDNNEIRFLDWEWAGVTKNKLLATIYDYGNLRARAWNNKEFREALDEAILEKFEKEGRPEAGKAIVSLGIFRSHSMLAGFFENYDHEKQRREEEQERRESTEADIRKAFEIVGIKL